MRKYKGILGVLEIQICAGVTLIGMKLSLDEMDPSGLLTKNFQNTLFGDSPLFYGGFYLLVLCAHMYDVMKRQNKEKEYDKKDG